MKKHEEMSNKELSRIYHILLIISIIVLIVSAGILIAGIVKSDDVSSIISIFAIDISIVNIVDNIEMCESLKEGE